MPTRPQPIGRIAAERRTIAGEHDDFGGCFPAVYSRETAAIAELDWDDRHGLWKANPLATWTESDVWSYIARHDLPYNPLHDQGYASIGCTHCTLPGAGREGRWAGLEKDECGIHVQAA